MGNHDKRVGKKYYEKLGFTKVYKKEFIIGNLILSHNPIEIKDGEYINIHAHIHNTEPNEKFKDNRHFWVSVEMTDYLPVNVMGLVGGDISGKSLYQNIEKYN